MTKKVVLKLGVHDEKEKKKALKAISSLTDAGIESLSMDMKEKKLTIEGAVDPIKIVGKLKKYCHTDLETVGPAKKEEEKKKTKEEPKKTEAAKAEELSQLYKNHYPYCYYCVHSIDENPNSCVIC